MWINSKPESLRILNLRILNLNLEPDACKIPAEPNTALTECSTLIASNTSIAVKSIWYDVKITWIQDACKWLHFINSNQKSVNSLNSIGAKQNIGPLFGCGLDLGGESWILKVSEKLLWSFVLLSSPLEKHYWICWNILIFYGFELIIMYVYLKQKFQNKW